MQDTLQILPFQNRYDAVLPASRDRYAHENVLSSTARRTCGNQAEIESKVPFYRISNDYFANEASRGFAVEAGVFIALILTALLPIANGVQAIATLIHNISVI